MVSYFLNMAIYLGRNRLPQFLPQPKSAKDRNHSFRWAHQAMTMRRR
jgi:hypothetical protein